MKDFAMGISAGVGTVAAGAQFFPMLPVNGEAVSLYQAHSVCSSSLGVLAQGMDTSVSSSCGMADFGWFLLWGIIVVCIITFAAAWWQSREGKEMPHTQRPCRCGGIQYWTHDERYGYAWHCPSCGISEKPASEPRG